jgi:hypothetical protein
MRRRTWAELRGALGAVLLALASSSARAAEPPSVKAELSCRPEAAPGRVLCELRYGVGPGLRLVWVDALVLQAPPFARPLRSRVTPERYKEASASERRLTLAFVASASGVGPVTVAARAVTCRGEGERESCRPERQELTAELRVGN